MNWLQEYWNGSLDQTDVLLALVILLLVLLVLGKK